MPRRAAAVLAAVLAGAAPVRAEEVPPAARLGLAAERMAVAQAIRGAQGKLAHPECRGLLDEFKDASGRPLRAALEEQAMGPGAYLDRMFFYDAPPAACEGTVALLGSHRPGSRVIRVCGRRFLRTVRESASYAEAAIIHELLHALGLGENPPTSHELTTRVLERCRR